jgi:hypothetical protein
MRSGIVRLLAFGIFALLVPSLDAQPGGPRGGDANAARYGWLSTLEEGKGQARKSGKPLMVVIRCVP